jgi:methyltransferase (TIGR00027 family)
MAHTVLKDVSDTAFWIAHLRHVETERPDALFKDPLAGQLAGNRGKDIANAMPRSMVTAWAIVMRTCIIDSHIRTALAEGADTVLNLGAGLDTRPYRMELPASLDWVEVDYAHIINYKKERLAHETPRCRLTRIKCDLADDAARRRLLGEVNASAKKLLVLTEGFVPYLSTEEVATLADDIRDLDHAKYWLVDYFSPQLLKYRQRQFGERTRNAPFKFSPDDWLGFFENHGWRCRQIRYLAEEAERLKRQIELPFWPALLANAQRLLAPSARRDAFKRMAGHILLEPGPVRAKSA